MSVKKLELETRVAHSLMKAFLLSTSIVGPLNEFMKLTPEANGVPPPPLELPYPKDARTLSLPRPTDIKVRAVDLRYIIENRKSVRSYSGEELSLEELSWLLWCTQGVREIRKDRPATYRNVPSGGSRHPFETYLVLNRVRGVPPGIYRFLALEHKLLEVRIGKEVSDEVIQVCCDQRFVADSAVLFIWSFIPSRTSWRYGPKSYIAMLEAGHICQNLYLSADAVDCGVCAIGAFDLDLAHKALGIMGDDEFVVYMATVGKKKQINTD